VANQKATSPPRRAQPLLLLSRSNPPTEGGRKKDIIHGSAHRGANDVAMPTDEDHQDGHFFSNHPERGAYFAT